MSDDEGYIIVPNPNNPNVPIRAKLLTYKKTKGQDFEYNEKYSITHRWSCMGEFSFRSIVKRISNTWI
jgi:hypothetical protein